MRPCSNYGLRICIGVCFTGDLVLVSLPLDFNTLPNSATLLTKPQVLCLFKDTSVANESKLLLKSKEKFVASDRSDKSKYLPLMCMIFAENKLLFDMNVTDEKIWSWEV